MPDIGTGGIKDREAKKHQEVLEREQSILGVACNLLWELSSLGLMMERIAERIKWGSRRYISTSRRTGRSS